MGKDQDANDIALGITIRHLVCLHPAFMTRCNFIQFHNSKFWLTRGNDCEIILMIFFRFLRIEIVRGFTFELIYRFVNGLGGVPVRPQNAILCVLVPDHCWNEIQQHLLLNLLLQQLRFSFLPQSNVADDPAAQHLPSG